MAVLIRRETAADVAAIRAVTKAAFAKPDTPDPIESPLVDWLRADEGWIPALSLVAVVEGEIVGHVACTRGRIDAIPALGLGPLSVLPEHQGRGVGKALMHTALGAADALDEPVMILLGSPEYYSRFGFRPASDFEIVAPDPQWREFFQVRTLSAYDGTQRGSFVYAEPFSRL